MAKLARAIVLAPLLLCLAAQAETARLQQARQAVLSGSVDSAIALLHTELAASPTGAAHLLLCRAYYEYDQIDPALRECEAAVSANPHSSEFNLWMARTYGQKASHANPLSAMSLARKVHESFEAAVAEDPNSQAAAQDLAEFYIAAPGLVGGGVEKARDLANRIAPRLPVSAHRILGAAAAHQGDLGTAERELQAAANISHAAAEYIDLAAFYANHRQPDKALAAIRQSIAADAAKDASLVDAASLLTKLHQSPELAEQCLQQYLSSSHKSDEAPAFKVHLQLGQLLAQRGDTAGARREYQAALALASGYAPAQKALQTLTSGGRS
ncbi:MAG: hypothetical protein KGK08_11415 [Acidobacteriota bacterium]|nr:hypothetical protein [Acidobacteriota bacterium]